jgi:hypothetical protein
MIYTSYVSLIYYFYGKTLVNTYYSYVVVAKTASPKLHTKTFLANQAIRELFTNKKAGERA